MSVGWAPAANLLYQAGAQDALRRARRAVRAGTSAAGRVRRGPGQRRLRPRRSGCATASARALEAAQHLGLAHRRRVPVSLRPRRRAAPAIPIRSSHTRKARTSSTSTRTCSSRTSSTRRRKASTTSSCSSATRPSAWGRSQGKLSNMNAVRILARISGEPIEQTGTTTARPFFHPVPHGAPGRARLHSRAPHADAQPPRGGRAQSSCRRALAAARVLRAAGKSKERVRARRGARRAQARRPDRRGHARQVRICSAPTRPRSWSASTPADSRT